MQTHYWSTAILRILATTRNYDTYRSFLGAGFSLQSFLSSDPQYKKLHSSPNLFFLPEFVFYFKFIYFCKRCGEICVLLNFEILYQIINETIKVLENNFKYSNWKYVRSFPCYKITFYKNKCLRCHLLNLFEN